MWTQNSGWSWLLGLLEPSFQCYTHAQEINYVGLGHSDLQCVELYRRCLGQEVEALTLFAQTSSTHFCSSTHCRSEWSSPHSWFPGHNCDVMAHPEPKRKMWCFQLLAWTKLWEFNHNMKKYPETLEISELVIWDSENVLVTLLCDKTASVGGSGRLMCCMIHGWTPSSRWLS